MEENRKKKSAGAATARFDACADFGRSGGHSGETTEEKGTRRAVGRGPGIIGVECRNEKLEVQPQER